MTTAADALQMLKDNDVKYVELRFTDIAGKEMHLRFPPRASTRTRLNSDSPLTARPLRGGAASKRPTCFFCPIPRAHAWTPSVK